MIAPGLPLPILGALLLHLASQVDASVEAVGVGGVQVWLGESGWTTETAEIDAVGSQWSVQAPSGRQASCWLQSTADQHVIVSFSLLGVNGLSLDKCGCHGGSLVVCSYDDTKDGLGCPANSPEACVAGGADAGKGLDGVGQGENADGGEEGGEEGGEGEDVNIQRNARQDPSANSPSPDQYAAGAATAAATGGSAASRTGDQSGSGWSGADLLDPASTATYLAPSLDELLAMPSSLVAVRIGPQRDIIDAIRKVSSASGVPSGLLAAMIIQESNADRTTITDNDGYGGHPADQQKDVGIIQSPLWRFPGATTAEKIQNGQDPYQNLSVFEEEAAETYARTGSWGQVAQVWYVGHEAGRLGGVTGGLSQETNYVLNVFGHLALGGSTYYPAGGY